jgi:PKD repeat protein
VKLTIFSSDSCNAESQQTIVINPAPTANFEFENACQGTPVQFTDLTQTGGSGIINSWAWNFGDDATGANNISILQNPVHTYNTTGIYQVTLTVTTADGCSSTTEKTISITEAPFIDFGYDNHCVETEIQFTPASGVIIANVDTWNWSFGDGITSALPNPQHTYNTPGNYIVTLIITNTVGCQNMISHPIAILPAPIANFSTNAPACSQHQVSFINNSSAPAGYIMRWEYNFGDGNSVVINSPANPNVTHTYDTYGVFNAVLTVVTNDSCSATTSRSIQILQSPQAIFDYDASCSGLPVQFTDLSQGNLISWAWNFGDSGSGLNNTSTQQNPVHTFQQAGSYEVMLLMLNANGCNDTVSQTISISPKPVVDFSYNNGCAADTVHFISSTFVDGTATASWVWQFGDNSTSTDVDPYHIYATPGTYSVSLTITNLNGCTNVKTRQVQVTIAPTAMFTTTTSSCSGTAVLFTDISSTPNGTIDTWNWNFGDGTIITVNAPANPDISHIYAAAGIYDVVLTIQTTTGCEAYYASAITINDAPATAFSYAGSCNEQPTTFTDLSQSSGGYQIIGWSWNFGDPVSGINNTSAMQNPQHLFSSPGTYNVTLTTENMLGCSNSQTQTLTITPEPAVDFLLSPSCAGIPVTFGVDASVTNIAQVASYLWDFGDGSAPSILAAPEHIYTQAGTYSVLLTITNLTGCVNSVSHPITVHAIPVAQFTNSGNCTANLVQFTDISYNPDGEDIVAWAWDFGVSATTNDTSSLQHPTYIYTTAGTYNVTLTITSESGCTSVKVMPVIVIPAPAAQYSYTAEPCHNGSVLFHDESISSQSVITGWYWEFTPGSYSTLQNPVHVFGDTDTCFNVKLVVTTANGCTDTLIKEVCIPSGLDVTFNYTQTCFGETTWFTPTLVEPVDGSISYYNWNFGDPVTGIDNESKLENPQHIFSKTGTFVVSLQAIDANNCSTTRYMTITVSPLPISSFSFSGGTCDSIVNFTDLTTVAPIARWIWNFGDGKSDTIDAPDSPNVNHSYPYPGVFDVTLVTQSVAGCSDSITKTLRRTPCISAEFAINDTIVCQKRSMRFTESSTCQAPIASWQWYFGDNTSVTYTSPQAFVEHTYAVAGNYTVKMVVATQMVGGMVTDTASNQVTVKPAAKAAYKWQDVCIGYSSEFENQTQSNSTIIKNYNWNFGVSGSSTDTSSLKNPAYQYDTFGQFDVKLVVTNTLGCTDTVMNKVNIFENPVADFDWNNSCEAKPVYFTDNSDSTSSAIAKWNWLFSEAGEVLGASTKANCTYSFGHAGIYDASLKITDRNGCYDTIRKQVAINSSPAAAFSIVENYEDMQGQVMLNNGTVNGTNFEWDFGNGKTSSATNPSTIFDKEGKYEIQLITWNGQNCTDTVTMTYELMFKGLFVPNAFNPGHFDPEVAAFRPKGTNLKTYYIEIFDRWGNLLWSSSKIDSNGSPAESWDGKIHGEVLKQDVYLWKISAQFLDGEYWDGHNIGNNDNMPQQKTGTVTLIR